MLLEQLFVCFRNIVCREKCRTWIEGIEGHVDQDCRLGLRAQENVEPRTEKMIGGCRKLHNGVVKY